MANSQVSSNSINSNYPVAGVNNDSKGFRDNFAAIKNAFNTTAYELSELRSKAVLKTALSSAVLENDLNNNTIYRARLSAYSETFYNIGNSNEGITINYELGNFQKVTSTNDFDLNFINKFVSLHLLARLSLSPILANLVPTLVNPSKSMSKNII